MTDKNPLIALLAKTDSYIEVSRWLKKLTFR